MGFHQSNHVGPNLRQLRLHRGRLRRADQGCLVYCHHSFAVCPCKGKRQRSYLFCLGIIGPCGVCHIWLDA